MRPLAETCSGYALSKCAPSVVHQLHVGLGECIDAVRTGRDHSSANSRRNERSFARSPKGPGAFVSHFSQLSGNNLAESRVASCCECALVHCAKELGTNVPPDRMIDLEALWDGFGAAVAGAIKRGLPCVGERELGVLLALPLERFRESRTSYAAKSSILKAYREIAVCSPDDRWFPELIDALDEASAWCVTGIGVSRPDVPTSILLMAEQVVHIWSELTRAHGANSRVRRAALVAARKLLPMILAAEIPEAGGISKLEQMILSLQLPTRPSHESPDPLHHDERELLRRELIKAADASKNSYRRNPALHPSRAKALVDRLVPLLRGHEPAGERRVYEHSCAGCKATFMTEPTISTNVTVVDVCCRTHRGFLIDVPGLILDRDYTRELGVLQQSEMVDEWNRRRVNVRLPEQERFSPVERIAIEIRFRDQGETERTFRITGCVRRAWSSGEGSSQFVILAAASEPVPDGFVEFVDRLPPKGRFRAASRRGGGSEWSRPIESGAS